MTARDREGLRALGHAVHELGHAVGWLGTLSGNGNAVAFAGSAQRAAVKARELFDVPLPPKKKRRKQAAR